MQLNPFNLKVWPLLFALIFSFKNIYAQNGNLDATFGINGKVILPKQSNYISIFAAAAQPDGKIVLAGFMARGTNHKIFVERLNDDGGIDNTFGSNGSIIIDSSSFINGEAHSVALQQDGQIIVAGYFGANIALLRLTTSGKPDSTFGNNSMALKKIGNFGSLTSLVIRADGEIVTGGYASTPSGASEFVTALFTKKGFLDSSYGTNGYTETLINLGFYDMPFAAAIENNGKVVLAGQTNPFVGDEYDFVTTRYTKDGILDSSFNNKGIATASFGVSNPGSLIYYDDAARGVVIQNDQKIVAAGYSLEENLLSTPQTPAFALIRYNIDGSIDSSFGVKGKVRKSIAASESYGFGGAVIQSDQKIIVGGYAKLASSDNYDFAMIRLKTDGSFDSTFGTNGAVTTDFYGASDFVYSISLQNKKIILVGNTSDSVIVLARYNNNDVLALNLDNFKAVEQQKNVLLNWQSNTGQKGNYFDVERSSNGIAFDKIGKVAAENSAETQGYNFKDVAPLQGTNYYRIKQVNNDGSFIFSKTLNIKFINPVNTIRIYPNPVKDKINIYGLPTGKSVLQLIDVSGKILQELATDKANESIITIMLTHGVYYLKVKNSGGITILKFLK